MKRKNNRIGNHYKEVRDYLVQNLIIDNNRYYGSSPLWTNQVADSWMNDQSNSKRRYELIKEFFKLDNDTKILDMASGCGTFVFYGLLNGYDAYGIEPERWKNKFNEMKIDLYNYPKSWRGKFAEAFGESLPFKDECFDVVSSYQTLEHVSDVKSCLKEMLRVTRKNGMILLQFPDYRSSFEGHYRMPWIPLFPKNLARLYLKMMNRPTLGLSTINYVTKRNIMNLIQDINYQTEVIDLDNVFFQRRMEDIIRKFNFKKIGAMGNILALVVNLIYTYFYTPIRRMFNSERNIAIIVRKL